MNIIIDADACPVQTEIINIAQIYELPVTLVKSYAHYSSEALPSHVSVVYVDKGAEMADFKIIQLAKQSDLVITQDYGLASMALGKKCYVMHHTGFMYTAKNIDNLMARRHANQAARRAGYKTKGPKAFTAEDRSNFAHFFEKTILQIITG
ncbi:MAG TPA: YaiI/YqxD family protein [Pseudogracilibacillus sp.]|nr:YaiI/YqxD family protein [Pseudogracilibacillus sp.]